MTQGFPGIFSMLVEELGQALVNRLKSPSTNNGRVTGDVF